MPALVAAFEGYTRTFWYPTIMPHILFTPDEEDKALALGFWHPSQYTKYLKKMSLNDNESGDNSNNDSNIQQVVSIDNHEMKTASTNTANNNKNDNKNDNKQVKEQLTELKDGDEVV